MVARAKPPIRELQQLPAEKEELLSALYHENSKLNAARSRELGERIAQLQSSGLVREIVNSYKSYPNLPQFALPRANLTMPRELQEVIMARRSTRKFDTGRTVALQELANSLQLSYGITGSLQLGAQVTQYLRAIPSGGGLYPLEMYLIVQRVAGLLPGLYHYRVAHHALEQLAGGDQAELLARTEREWGMCGSAAFDLVISAVFDRSQIKYLERGYRFVLLEAGMLSQNATMIAESQGIRSCMMGGWLDDELNRVFGLDGFAESVVLSICFGHEVGATCRAP